MTVPLPEPYAEKTPLYYPMSALTTADPGPMWPDLYTADQLRAYGDACAAEQRERDAQICEQWDATHPHRLAAAIRAGEKP